MIVSIGEPLLEFNQVEDRTYLQGLAATAPT
jgi:hypothetical protein